MNLWEVDKMTIYENGSDLIPYCPLCGSQINKMGEKCEECSAQNNRWLIFDTGYIYEAEWVMFDLFLKKLLRVVSITIIIIFLISLILHYLTPDI